MPGLAPWSYRGYANCYWPMHSRSPMLSPMKRRIDPMGAGAFVAVTLAASVSACAATAPRGALAPTQEMALQVRGPSGPEWVDPTGSDRILLAQADVPTDSANAPAPPPTPLPSRIDASGPLPPTDPNDQSTSSAEPPNPSEYSTAADTDPSALGDFHDSLAPYGTWEEDATYGTVWVPASTVVGADFTPYVSAGHWGLDG